MSCAKTIDGIISGGTGGSTNISLPVSVMSGEMTIPPGRILDEVGVPVLDEDGNYVLEEYVGPVFVLDEDGGYVLDENDRPVLSEDSQPSVLGRATQLITDASPSQYVIIQAKYTNQKKVWIGGETVRNGFGIYLSYDSQPIRIDVDDISKVYVAGYIGDGVYFTWGSTEDVSLALFGTDGYVIRGTDGEILEGTG